MVDVLVRVIVDVVVNVDVVYTGLVIVAVVVDVINDVTHEVAVVVTTVYEAIITEPEALTNASPDTALLPRSNLATQPSPTKAIIDGGPATLLTLILV